MSRKSSPERSSPDPNDGTGTPLHIVSDNELVDMAAVDVVAPSPISAANKRFRPAPAKTFQCRGYGDCRMVFSRSEHLARHIRKHTGERPFTCHCGKQFSRLDNLRQHAQTVHADKLDQNERMMRDLTTLHATMAAANKAGNPRGGRRTTSLALQPQSPMQPSSVHTGSASPSSGSVNGSGMELIKQEDLTTMPIHHRSDVGYDGDEHLLYHQQTASWHTADLEPRPSSRNAHHQASQSFREPSSFTQSQSQSFLPFQPALAFGLPNGDAPRNGSGSRPGTSGERLPPLSSIVSSSMNAPPSPQSQQQAYQQQQSAYLRPRPSTANRPSSSSSATSFYPNPPMNTGVNGKSSFYGTTATPNGLHYGRAYAEHLPHPQPASSVYEHEGSHSPGSASAQHDPSPFYFQPPAAERSASPAPNPRKRAFAGPDGPVHSYDELASYTHPSHHHHPQQQQQHHPNGLDYDYGSESRPQSRRLSVMELCNDQEQQRHQQQQQQQLDFGAAFMNIDTARPTTASGLGLVGNTSALSIFDRGSVSPPNQNPHSHVHRGSNGSVGSVSSVGSRRASGDDLVGNGMMNGMGHGPGRVSPPSRRVTPAQNGVVANGVNGTSYGHPQPPPPRPHSTAYSVSSNGSGTGSPPHHQYQHAQQQQFAYAHQQQHQQQQVQQQQQQQQQSYAHALPLNVNLQHHHLYNPSPTSASSVSSFGAAPYSTASHHSHYSHSVASSLASPRTASPFSPRSPPGHGPTGVMAHQQAQAYHALQTQGYGHGHGHGHGHGGGYESAGYVAYAA